ncbi:MAG TPA: ATP synthase subunit I [Kofleriaceae bacterium]|nr:ATP synthase subunit I [Kofleriaceae bacterium]
MASPSIHRIERLNYALAIVVTLVGLLTQSRSVVLGLVVGSGLTCLNFFVLRKLVVKWTTAARTGKGGGTASMLMLPKMVFLMGAVTLSVLLLPIDVIAFTIGYSIFIVSIVIEASYSALRTEPSADHEPDNSERPNG